jgi:hypothetical protein
MAAPDEPKPPAPSQSERAALRQAEKQAAFDEQVETGQLIVREMTAAEQRKWAARKKVRQQEPRKQRPSY